MCFVFGAEWLHIPLRILVVFFLNNPKGYDRHGMERITHANDSVLYLEQISQTMTPLPCTALTSLGRIPCCRRGPPVPSRACCSLRAWRGVDRSLHYTHVSSTQCIATYSKNLKISATWWVQSKLLSRSTSCSRGVDDVCVISACTNSCYTYNLP